MKRVFSSFRFEKIEFECKSELAIGKLWNSIFSYLLYVGITVCVYLLFKYIIGYVNIRISIYSMIRIEVKLISVLISSFYHFFVICKNINFHKYSPSTNYFEKFS